jgi:hypothetical protein
MRSLFFLNSFHFTSFHFALLIAFSYAPIFRSLSPPCLMSYPTILLVLLSLISATEGFGPRKSVPAPALHRPRRGGLTSQQPDLYLGRPRLLPIERLNAARVRLRWNALPETDTQGYQVERSADADYWTALGYVPVTRSHRYCFDDTTAQAFYYRVVRLDFSRRLTASLPVRSTYAVPLGPLVASPNPAHGPVRLLGRDPALCVDLLNGRGEVVHQVFASGFTTDGLLPGTYLLRQGRQITRFVVR